MSSRLHAAAAAEVMQRGRGANTSVVHHLGALLSLCTDCDASVRTHTCKQDVFADQNKALHRRSTFSGAARPGVEVSEA